MSSLLSQLHNRGCIHDMSDEKELEQVLDGEPLTFYCGFDPTASSLHVGSMLPLLLMRTLQSAGHKPLVLLGTATGMVGDPSGKSQERNLLSPEDVQANARGIEAQVARFLSKGGANGFEIVRNDSWLRPLSCLDFLRDVGKHFSVNAMMAKESVKARLENREQGISYTEFSYMLLQAYDFFWLYENRGCRLQVGGSDQWGNITAGLELIRRKTGASAAKAYGMTFPLITTSSGQKFGKTEAGAVWLDRERTSPFNFYQFWLRTEDNDAVRYLKLFLGAEGKELEEFKRALREEPEKRFAQERLATEITSIVHGEDEAKRAREAAKLLFSAKSSELNSDALLSLHKDAPSTRIAESELARNITVQELLVRTALAKSKSEARRFVDGGGVSINDERISNYAAPIEPGQFIDGKVMVLRCGKKNTHILILERS